ncbi:tRNA (guanine-N(7)-)-methyltransferase [bacterium MnTg02]|nr:tRNA (guanine-N(7)-)-methyltransferase [bacterium MnTg02]
MAETDGRLYGRHRSHSLSQRQQALYESLLPRLRIDCAKAAPNDLGKLFASPKSDVWLEIGFGAGEHLAWQAQQQPDIGIIGCEPYINGVAKLLSQIELDGLQNIRIFDDDARLLFDWLPDASIGRVFLLFSDPWPKKRHRKRRFVTLVTLDQLARIMRPDAQLRVASDVGDFVRTTLLAIQSHDDFHWLNNGPSDWRSRPSDWPETRYEQKAIGAGRTPVYLSFARQ